MNSEAAAPRARVGGCHLDRSFLLPLLSLSVETKSISLGNLQQQRERERERERTENGEDGLWQRKL